MGVQDIYRNKASLGNFPILNRHLFSIAVTPLADAFPYYDAKTTNFSDDGVVITPYSGTLRYPMLRFDISSLPTPFTVTGALLRIYGTNISGAGRIAVCYRLLRTDWVETEMTWNIYKTGSNWTTGGAEGSGTDYSATNPAYAYIQATGLWTSFDVTLQVNAMLNDGLATANFKLKDAGTSAPLDNSFADRENVDPAKWPQLIIAGYQ